MKTYFIWQTDRPHDTQKQFIGHTKKNAIWLYLQEFAPIAASELTIKSKPYMSF